MKIIFFGTSDFAANILQFLFEKNVDIQAVVTRPDRPRGRTLRISSTMVKQLAQKCRPDIPIFQPEKVSTSEFSAILRAFQSDLFVVVAFGEIIKKEILEIPRLGCINVHASQLPKYRGAAPMQRCLMDGATITGVSIIEMTPQMDAGDILEMATLEISSDMTLGELGSKLCVLSCQLLLKVIDGFQKGNIHKTPQDHSLATFAPKIAPEEEEIHWSKSAEQIHNLIRALSPRPGAWCKIQMGAETKRLKILRSRILKGKQADPGEVLSFGKEGWIVACGQDSIQLLEVQLEGKKVMSAAEFITGMRFPLTKFFCI